MNCRDLHGAGSAKRKEPEMGSIRMAERKCATCEHWQGAREINRVNRREVSYANGMQGCEQKRYKVSGRSGCPQYRKWAHLP